jgi:hypothetical protein
LRPYDTGRTPAVHRDAVACHWVAASLRGGLLRVCEEHRYGSVWIDRGAGDSRQVVETPLHPQAVESDLGQVGAELASARGENGHSAGADSLLKGIGIGEGENATLCHASVPPHVRPFSGTQPGVASDGIVFLGNFIKAICRYCIVAGWPVRLASRSSGGCDRRGRPCSVLGSSSDYSQHAKVELRFHQPLELCKSWRLAVREDVPGIRLASPTGWPAPPMQTSSLALTVTDPSIARVRRVPTKVVGVACSCPTCSNRPT